MFRLSVLQGMVGFCAILHLCTSADILMVTMGGTKSHKIPFWELARGLTPRGHNITFLNAFPADFVINGLQEITPAGLVFYVKNYTNWDLVGARMRGEEPVSPMDIIKYGYEACDAMLSDAETRDLLNRSFDLLIIDGAYPECALALAHHFSKPFMFINTVGFYTGSLSLAGNPTPYSVTPFLGRPFTDNMGLVDKTLNAGWHIILSMMHSVMVRVFLQGILRKHFGNDVPPVYEMTKNVSFILQNSHVTVSYARPYLPNVAEIACIHCKPAKPLPKDLEDFIAGSGDSGFIFVSMGSSVKAANMPEYLRRLLVRTFAQLPYRVLWKWEAGSVGMPDLPENVKLGRWLPQQDILGHRKLRAFVTHGGLLSMFESVYHGVPVVTMPVFCDHEANAAKAELDGYALKLSLERLTSDALLRAITKVIHDPKYREQAKKRQILFKDQKESPLDRAVYWTEYVLRHNGALHLQSPARHLGIIEYYMLDSITLVVVILAAVYVLTKRLFRLLVNNVRTEKLKVN